MYSLACLGLDLFFTNDDFCESLILRLQAVGKELAERHGAHLCLVDTIEEGLKERKDPTVVVCNLNYIVVRIL